MTSNEQMLEMLRRLVIEGEVTINGNVTIRHIIEPGGDYGQPPVAPPEGSPPPGVGQSEYPIMNSNPQLAGGREIRLEGATDERWQYVPADYAIHSDRGEQGVPPWVHRIDDDRDGGNAMKIKVSYIDGEIGYVAPVLLPPGCYLLKINADWEVTGSGNLSDLSVNAFVERAHADQASHREALNRQPLAAWTANDTDFIFPFRIDSEGLYQIGGFLKLQWASYDGQFVMRRFEVLQVGDDYCNGAPTIS